MRNVDDYAVQFVFFQLRNYFNNPNLYDLFRHFEYSYGWLYWIVYSLAGEFLNKFVTLPLISESQIIFFSRQVTLLFFLFSLILLYRIIMAITIFKIRTRKILILIVSIYFAITPGIKFLVMSAEPPIFALFITLLGFLLIFEKKSNYIFLRNRSLQVYLGIFIVGASLSVKLTNIITIFFLFMLYIFSHDLKLHQIINIFRNNYYLIPHILIFGFSYFINLSPYIIMERIGTLKYVIQEIIFFSKSSGKINLNLEAGIKNYFEVLTALNLRIEIIFVIFILIFLLKENVKFKILFLFSISNLIILIFSLFLYRGVDVVVSYSSGIIYFVHFIVIYVLYIYLTQLTFKEYQKILLITLYLIAITIFSFSNVIEAYKINYYEAKYELYVKKGIFNDKDKIKMLYDESYFEKVTILQDWESPLIWSNFREDYNVVIVFDDWIKRVKEFENSNLLIVLDPKKNYLDSTNVEVMNRLHKNKKFGNSICKMTFRSENYLIYNCEN